MIGHSGCGYVSVPGEQTLRARMIQHLVNRGCDSIAGIAEAISTDRTNVYSKVSVAKRLGHVTEDTTLERNPYNDAMIRVHKVYITEKGKAWLKTLVR